MCCVTITSFSLHIRENVFRLEEVMVDSEIKILEFHKCNMTSRFQNWEGTDNHHF